MNCSKLLETVLKLKSGNQHLHLIPRQFLYNTLELDTSVARCKRAVVVASKCCIIVRMHVSTSLSLSLSWLKSCSIVADRLLVFLSL